MPRSIGPLLAEITEAESAKFTSPMLLVHGLWEAADVWRRFTGYLTHRGWRCIAVQLRGRAGTEPVAAAAEHLADIRAAIATLEAPPVLVGHDLGAVVALQAAAMTRAVVALAPIVPMPVAVESPRALRHSGNWLTRRFGLPLSPPGGRWRSAYPSRRPQVSEAAAVVRDVVHASVPIESLPPHVPGFVLAGERDPVTSVAAGRDLATHVGARFQVCAAGGHTLHNEPGWDENVAAIHRWIVQRLGAPLLALYEETDGD